MKYFWFLSIYSVRPDGGTQMILLHHDHLLRNGKLSYIVTNNDIRWRDHKIQNCVTIYEAVKMIKQDDILISSWDDHILGTFKTLKLGRKIAYIQSHFANHPQTYKTDFEIITVSNFAQKYIKDNYGKDSKVLPNVVRIPKAIRMISFNEKKNLVVTAQPRRDIDVFNKFVENNPSTKVNVLEWKDRLSFLRLVSKYKYYLSFYRLDAFGLPPIEAMAMGTIPIIISNTTGKDYRTSNNCVFYNVDNYMSGATLKLDTNWSDILNGDLMSWIAKCTAERYKLSKILEVIN